jgi:hypothetical protein
LRSKRVRTSSRYLHQSPPRQLFYPRHKNTLQLQRIFMNPRSLTLGDTNEKARAVLGLLDWHCTSWMNASSFLQGARLPSPCSACGTGR